MKPVNPLPLVPYVPQIYRAKLQAIQTPVPAITRPVSLIWRDLPSIYRRRPYDAHSIRQKQLEGRYEDVQSSSMLGPAEEAVVAEQRTVEGKRKKLLPFFREEAHRQPTRGLYRALLRACRKPTPVLAENQVPGSRGAATLAKYDRSFEGIRAKIRYDWRRYRHLTSIPETRNFLAAQYDLRSGLISARPAELEEIDAKHRRSRELFPSLPSSQHLPACPNGELPQVGSIRPRSRPRLTGGFMRPTHFNGPLPRLKPQPVRLTMMIAKRLRQQIRLKNLARDLGNYKADMRAEVAFMKSLAGHDPSRVASSDDTAKGFETGQGRQADGLDPAEVADWSVGWNSSMYEQLKGVNDQLQAGWGRRLAKFDEGVMRRVERAKRKRQAYLRDKAEERKRGTS